VPVSLSVVSCRQFRYKFYECIFLKPVFCILRTLDVMKLGVRGVRSFAHRTFLSKLPARFVTTACKSGAEATSDIQEYRSRRHVIVEI
jgi:hypothetical protein